MKKNTFIAAAAVIIIGASAGCGPASAHRYRAFGTVTCGGEPVVAGEMLFTPDGTKRNAGPQGVATICDGRFDTSGSRAPGVGGGATIVRVVGVVGRDGKRVVRHEFAAELPRGDHEFTIEIPATAAADAGPES